MVKVPRLSLTSSAVIAGVWNSSMVMMSFALLTAAPSKRARGGDYFE